jgi:ABC-type glycerol-3-phosphate transport system substrate-binding protein
MRKLMSLFLVLGACVLLSACSKEAGLPTEITLIHGWGSTENDHVVMREIYGNFAKENPDIRLNLISMPTSTEAISKVEDMVMVGKIPDILFLGGGKKNTLYEHMAKKHLALDMMPFLEQDPAFLKNISPTNLKYWTTENGALYNISDVLSLSGGYWYDVDILAAAGFNQAPSTWEGFVEMCRAINTWALHEKKDIKALQPSSEGYLYFLGHLLADHDPGFPSRHTTPDDAQILRAFEALEALYDQSFSGNGHYSYLDETSLFNQGKLAISINGVWGAPMIHPKKNVAYALIPFSEGSLSCISSGQGFLLGKTGDPVREQASVRFLKYMLSPQVQERILKQTQQVPANPNIDIKKYADSFPRFYQAVETVQSAGQSIEIPNLLWSDQQFDLILNQVFSVLSGEMDKQDFLDLFHQAARQREMASGDAN